MKKTPTPSIVFDYQIPGRITLTMPRLRKALKDVQEQLLAHRINGGDRQLDMCTVTSPKESGNKCGMAACIGGWTSLMLLGFEGGKVDNRLEDAADDLFGFLVSLDNEHGSRENKLHELFYDYANTIDYNEPNVAATAIGRYLRDADEVWPNGEMPRILPYTKRAPRKSAQRK